ncbi:MAG: FAD binding domain-containing protein [Gammaproteobacteria bacterium]|nr:FAD binding domain-containing protein [Gammaproteobacteria bacterium]
MALPKLREFITPADAQGVLNALRNYQDRALIVAGGTFLHGLESRGLLTHVEALIDIQRLGLDYLESGKDGLKLGATALFADLETMPEIRNDPWLGAIKDALVFPPVQVKNAATIGGSVAASCPFFDVPISFMCLDGVVKCRGSSGMRDIPMQEFFTGLFANAMENGEFMVELAIPRPRTRSASAFMKVETNANDLAILNAAVRIDVDESGTCSDARVIAGGGVGETPIRLSDAEQVLVRQRLTPEICARAGLSAKGSVNPISDHRASAAYRSEMTRVMVNRALRQALDRLRQ